MNFLYRHYVRLQWAVSGADPAFHRRMKAILEREPERSEAIRARYRAMFAPVLRRWSILSANYRTLGIFISALFKVPQYYFGFEIFGFSVILIVLLLGHRARIALFLGGLEAAEQAA
jgi:hypothetical protein